MDKEQAVLSPQLSAISRQSETFYNQNPTGGWGLWTARLKRTCS